MAQHEENKKKVIREFGLSSFSVDNRTSVIVLTFILTVMGIIAYRTMPKESFPEIVIPTIYVGTAYPGNSPVDMENLITRSKIGRASCRERGKVQDGGRGL